MQTAVCDDMIKAKQREATQPHAHDNAIMSGDDTTNAVLGSYQEFTSRM